MNEHQNDSTGLSGGKPKIYFFPLWFVLMFGGFTGCFALSYLLSVRLWGLSGFASYWAAGVLGIVIFISFAAVLKLCMELHDRMHPGNRRTRAHDHTTFLQSTVEAMNRIAHGDFNILVPVDEHDPFSKVAESVNKMAHELSSMENLRQDFISNVSHEIQSPLTSIIGFAVLLKNNSLPEKQRLQYLEIIEAESKRLSGLSANLLKLSALESEVAPLSPHEYRLDRQIESAVLMLEPQWNGKNLSPNLDLPKMLAVGDEELLNQVWINLLHNATKFTPDGGEFGVVLSADKSEISCTVSDTGIGISAEDKIHIFERFYKADKSRDRSLGGNGLGLSLVKKIVELHGGTIDLQSEPGKGAAFTVQLPIKK
ncbi:HAMP domain-containing histidine kinase [Lachnospiraceae bacterium ZAX-1]